MQNFKQFLIKKDNSSSGAFFKINLHFKQNVKIYSDYEYSLYNLSDDLKKELNNNEDVFFVSETELVLIFDINDFSKLQEFSDNILETVRKILQAPEDFLDLHQTTIKLYLTEMPKQVVEWDYITVDCSSSIRLANIHKLLKCEKLDIIHASYITGNILGIILIDKNISLNIYDTNGAEWMKIVYGYRDGSGDILECQEELITKGFRQYAKL